MTHGICPNEFHELHNVNISGLLPPASRFLSGSFEQSQFSDFVCLLGSISVKHFPPARKLLKRADSPVSK